MYSLSFLRSAPVQDETAESTSCYFLYFIKAQRFVDIVSALIKVDPLQLRIMYYSNLNLEKLRRRLF